MTPPELTKQLTTYADAFTAFSVVQALAFCYSIAAKGEGFAKAVLKDKGALFATIGIIIGTGVYCFLVTKCMDWPDQYDKQGTDIASELSAIQVTRLWLIVLSGVLSLFALWATKLDPRRG